MKKQCCFLVLLFFTQLLLAKVPSEAYELTNGLNTLWEKGKTDEAVASCLKLNVLYRPFFVDRMHGDFSRFIAEGALNATRLDFLKKLYKKGDLSVKQVLEPLMLWNETHAVRSAAEADKVLTKALSLLADTVVPDVKAEEYSLLIVKNLDGKSLGSAELKKRLLDAIRANLKKYPHLETSSFIRLQNETRSWYRYMLAYTSYYAYKTQGGVEQDLRDAARYSPDLQDIQCKYIYADDAYLLDGQQAVYDYRQFLYEKLKLHALENPQSNDLLEEAFAILLERCYAEPLPDNIKELRSLYAKLNVAEPLEKRWYTYVNERMKPVPALRFEYPGEVLDLTAKRNGWVYIDVWGSWCPPCRKELPEFNVLAAKINADPNAGVRMYTFSYNSGDLQDFMQKNNYTFPVVEVGADVTNAFGVTGFPSKILISPDNRYLFIPFGSPWPEYLKGYMLKE